MANDFRLHNGTYLGQVIDNNDPDNINRLLVKVPELDPNGSMYFKAMPKGMMAGKNFGFNFVPGKGDYVYISFRLGLLDYPLWEPGYWAIGEKPEEFNKDMVGYKFRDGSVLSYDEKESEFTLLLKSGDFIVLRDNNFTFATNDGAMFNIEDGLITILNNGRKLTLGSEGIYIDAGSGDLIIHNNSASVSISDSGVDISSDKDITIGGNKEVLYSKVPGATQILDISEIGVSSKVKIG